MSGDRSVYIRYIYDCIGYIEAYTEGGKDEFFRDRKTQDAVIRNIEVIGQAVKDFSIDELMATDPQIPWSKIAGMRNILAHQYLGVDLVLIWEVVENHLPALKRIIIAIAGTMGIELDQVGDDPGR